MKKLSVFVLVGLAVLLCSPAQSVAENEFKVCWSHYTGWEPWGYADHAGIVKKWANKFGIKIKVERVNDYIESINLYTSGQYIGCTMTNMDALTIPAVGGVDSTALIVGDFSNGNDGIVMRNGKSVSALKGREVKLVELSVSHYLLTRALEMNGLTEKDLKLVNTSDADIGSVFLSDKNGAAVTWNPILMNARNGKGVEMVFDSSHIPGEIIDMMVVKSSAPEKLKKALVGAWYETLKIMSGGGKKAEEAIAFMARESGSTVQEFKAQLKTTAMFYDPKRAVDFYRGTQLKKTMEDVRSFSFDHGLYGKGASSKDLVGMSFPSGSVLGDKKNVKLRFEAKYSTFAAKGIL